MPTTLKFVLWLTPTVLEIVIVMVMLSRKLWRDLPIFFSYLIFAICRTLFLVVERNNPWVYFYGYWIAQALGCFAVLCVSKELFNNAFHEHLGLRKLGDVIFRWSILILIVLAVLTAWLSHGAETNRIMAGIFVLKRAETLVQTGLLAFLFLFVFAFGLAWQHYVIGIALGFGIYGVIECVALVMHMRYGFHKVGDLYNFLIMTAYNCSVLIWAVYFLIPVRKKVERQPNLSDHKHLLDQWNEGLLEMMQR